MYGKRAVEQYPVFASPVRIVVFGRDDKVCLLFECQLEGLVSIAISRGVASVLNCHARHLVLIFTAVIPKRVGTVYLNPSVLGYDVCDACPDVGTVRVIDIG